MNTSLKEKRRILLRVQQYSLPWQGSPDCESLGGQEEDSDRCCWARAHGIGPLTLRMVFLSLLTQSIKIPHKDVRRLFFLRTLDCTKLAINIINQHKGINIKT